MEKLPNYPKAQIKQLNLEKFELFFGSEFEDTVGLRFDADEQGLCRSRKRTIFPQSAKNPNGLWLTIINNEDDSFVQGIVVEECE